MAGTRVYVGRLPYRVNERDLEHFFKGYGRISEVILKNGYAFVEFSDYRDADDACHDLNGRDLQGARVMIELARGTPRGRDRYNWRPPPTSSRSSGRSSGRRPSERRTDYRLTVENLSSRVSWQDLKDYFRTAGEVTYADAHTKHKNEGVVEFASKSDMKNAMEKMDGKEINGRKIKLVPIKARSRSRSRSPRKRSRSASGSRSRSRSKEGDGKKEKKDKKRSRSRSAGSRSRSPEQNGKSPSPKRERTESEKQEQEDEEGPKESAGDD